MTDLLDTDTPASDRAITADLMARLERHYIKPGDDLAGGMFLPEVGWNGSANASRCDALYVGFTGTSGRMLIGHEVKASRSDWLNELRKPGKADAWADQCHEWWLVTIPGVVAPGELPPGWGLMLPGKSRTRMQIVTPATRHHDRQPSWEACRSIIARQDTLQRAARSAFERDLTPKIRAKLEREQAQRDRMMRDLDARDEWEAVEVLKHLDGILGIQIRENGWGRRVTPDEVRDLVELLRSHVTLRDARKGLAARYDHIPIASILEHAGALAAEMKALGGDRESA